MGYIYPAVGSQIQQSSNHQIHVVSNITHFSNVTPYDCRHNAIVSSTEAKFVTMYVILMLIAATLFTTLILFVFLDWYEWGLLIMLSGLLLFELTNPSDKSGLGSIKLLVLLFGMAGVGVHVAGMIYVQKAYWPTLLYCRNQFFALSFLLACVQILDFLSFHHLFGPWAIIIGDLLKDLARFLAVLAIFVFGFSMHIVALNQPFKNMTPEEVRSFERNKNPKATYFKDGKLLHMKTFL